MKKTLIATLTILIILTIIILLIGNKELKKGNKEDIKNIKVTTETFTLTDNGTEIEVKLKNKNKKDIVINNINITLYDSENKKITTIKYNKKIELKENKEKIVKITEKEKYPATTDIKYKLTK